jgi:hypothetical protein
MPQEVQEKRDLQLILAEARQLRADGASKQEVSRFVFDATNGRTADVERLQRAVSGAEELPRVTFKSFKETGEDIAGFARGAAKVAGKAGQLALDAAGNPLAATVGLLTGAQKGAQAVGRFGGQVARHIAEDPINAAGSTLKFLAGENPLDILGPETAATALFRTKRFAEAAGDIGKATRRGEVVGEIRHMDDIPGPGRRAAAEHEEMLVRREAKNAAEDADSFNDAPIVRTDDAPVGLRDDQAAAKGAREAAEVEAKTARIASQQQTKTKPGASKASHKPTPVDDPTVPPARSAAAVPDGLPLTDNARILRDSHAANGGSTIDPRTGRDFGGDDVWAVTRAQADGSPHGTLFDEPPTTFEVREFIKANKELLESDETLMVGSWWDEAGEAHGKHELSITKVFAGDQQAAAQRFAQDNNQWGMVNLADPEFEAISVADEAAQAFKRQQLDEIVPERTAARLERFMDLLSPEEKHNFEFTKTGRKRSKRVQQDALKVFSLMPQTEQGVQMAMLGSEMAHWYRSSATALRKAFGADAPRFSALLASTSPNVGVPDNLGASLQIWRDWQRAGRPVDAASIEKMIKSASDKWGITPTAFNNTRKILGLTNEQLLNPRLLKAGGMLSGPKVDPFYANLVGELQRLVIDTHMKAGYGLAKDQVRVAEGIGAQAAMTDVARAFQELTGSPVDVADMQAAQWAGIRAIRDLQRKGAGGRSRTAEDLLLEEQFGTLFGVNQGFSGKVNLPNVAEQIRLQPSFDNLLRDKRYGSLLSELGIDIPPASVQAGLQGIDPANARFADVLAFAKRMDLRDQKKFLYGAAGALLLGNAEDVDARALAGDLLMEAGLSQGTVDSMDARSLGSYAGLLSERPLATMEEMAQFGKNLGLGSVPGGIMRDLGRDTVRVQPKSMAERADSIIADPNRTPSIPGRFLEGAKGGFPVKQILGLLASRLGGDEERTNTAVSSSRPGLLTRGGLGR